MEYGNYNNNNAANTSQKEKSSCSTCFGCCLIILISIIAIISIGSYSGYRWLDTSGRAALADWVDQTIATVLDSKFKDKESKNKLKTNVKILTDKIRNRELGLTELALGMQELNDGGYGERIMLLTMYGDSNSENSNIKPEEKQALAQVIKAIYDQKINVSEIRPAVLMLNDANKSTNKNHSGKSPSKQMDQAKMHEALSYIIKLANEKQLEVPAEENFKFEQYVSDEVESAIKKFMDGIEKERSKNAPAEEKPKTKMLNQL